MLSPDAPLSELHVRTARKELHELKDHIDAHVLSLQRWVQSMPHLICPEDKRIYIAFLRHAKYSHARAQGRIDNLATLRSSPSSPTSAWFDRYPKTHPLFAEYMRMKIHIPIGFLQDGTYLMILRMVKWDATTFTVDDLFRFATVHMDRLVEDPRIQVCGLRVLFDMTGMDSKQVTAMNPRKTGKEVTKLFQEGYPVRVKSFIYYNEPAILDFVLKIMTHWMKPKMKERIIRCKDKIERACKKVPGLKEVLPSEYGGGNASMDEIIKQQYAAFENDYEKPRIWDGMKVDESKRPDSAKYFMKQYKDYSEQSTGAQGTYIKLDDQD